ncbi:MAG TPA: hypothetical protein VGI10_24465 [Polyangiaceae bacterium]
MSRRERIVRLGVASAYGALLALTASVAHADPPVPPPASDDEGMPPPGYLPGHREEVGLGLSPHVPEDQSILPGGIAPAPGAPLRPNEGAKFDFQGHVQAGGRAGFNARANRTGDQSSEAWHGTPMVPGGNGFENTNTVPYSWAELRFSYSTPHVRATVSLASSYYTESSIDSGTFLPNQELAFREAFLQYNPADLGKLKLEIKVGAFEDRYGGMGQYDSGRYGAPLIATIRGAGETTAARFPLADRLKLVLEHGIKANLDRPPAGLPSGPANNWPKPWESTTIVNHSHIGFDYDGVIMPSFHWIETIARDDQGDNVDEGSLRAGYRAGTDIPGLSHADASMRILAADVRLNLRRWGYLYAGASHVDIKHARVLSGVIGVLNVAWGRDLMDRYIGRNNDQGNGKITLIGAQYDVGLGELLRYPGEFWGDGPDLHASIYGVYAHVNSPDQARNGENELKFGTEETYQPLSWLALGTRFDHAIPYMNRPKAALYPGQNDNSFSVYTLKTILRSDWQSRETLTIQYSRYAYRSNFHLLTVTAAGNAFNVRSSPDENLLAIFGTLWW